MTAVRGGAAPEVLDLGVGHPDPRLLPSGMIAAAAAAMEDPVGALQYGAEWGAPAFRERLAGFLADQTGVATPPERLMATSGISQALDLVCTRFAAPGDVVLVEEPTYFLARDVFADHGLEAVGVPVDDGGVDLELLGAAAREHRPAFFYTIPFFQNPSGASLAPSRRRGLLELARSRDLLVVSDEAYQLLAFGGACPPTLAEDGAPVIALGSFSKILAPGMRLGWLQGPPDLVQRVARAGLVRSGGGLNPFAAATAATLIGDGTLANHVAELRNRYRDGAAALVRALTTAADGRLEIASVGASLATEAPIPGGYFVWVRVPGVDMEAALPAFRAAGVAYQPGVRFSSRGGLADHARLCFAYYDEDELREAGARFARGLAASFGG